jgi:hypothetical protein
MENVDEWTDQNFKENQILSLRPTWMRMGFLMKL